MRKNIYILLAVLAFVKVTSAQTELVSTGTGSAYALSYPAAFTYSSGITITFKAHTVNTGAATLNINGLGTKDIFKNVTTPLAFGDIAAGQFVTIIYDGTNFQLTTPVSSSSAPSWALAGNAGTTSAANFIGTTDAVDFVAKTNNVERLRIVSGGTVGIGTSTPAAGSSLHVLGSTKAAVFEGAFSVTTIASSVITEITNNNQTVNNYNLIGFSDQGSGGNPSVKIGAQNTDHVNDYADFVVGTRNIAGFTEKMRVTSNGNVGIGTTFPIYRLHLYSTANNGSDILSETDGGRVIKHWFQNGGRSWSIGQTGTTVVPQYNFVITDETAGASRLAIKTNGYVGMGTTDPASNLHIRGIGLATELLQNADHVTNKEQGIAQINFADALTTNPQASINVIRDEISSGSTDLPTAISFSTIKDGNDDGALTERMRINSIGWLGIGTTVPEDMLSVGGLSQFLVSDDGNIRRIKGLDYNWPSTHAAGFLQNDGTGALSFGALPSGANAWTKSGTTIYNTVLTDNVGVGTVSPNNKFVVLGNASVPTIPNTSTTAIVRIGTSSTEGIDIGKLGSGSFAGWIQAGLTGSSSDPLAFNPLGGNVGISTDNPLVKLDVRGNQPKASTIAFENIFQVASRDAASPFALRMGIKTDATLANRYAAIEVDDAGTKRNLVLQPTGGNVGIGTIAPQNHLSIFRVNDANMSLSTQGAAAGDDISFNFQTLNNVTGSLSMGVASTKGWALGARGNAWTNVAERNMFFAAYWDGATWKQPLNLLPNGNVGIGTTAPTEALEVVGNIEIPAANEYSYTTAKTHYYSVACNLLENNGSAGSLIITPSANYCYFSGGSTFTTFYATTDVHLPDGAVITGFTAYLYDNDATYTASASLISQPYGAATSGNISTATTSADLASAQTISNVVSSTVDNSANCYKIRFDGKGSNNNIRFYGARITYSVTNAD